MLSRKVQVLQETIRKLLGVETDRNLKNILDKTMPADIAQCMGAFDTAEQEKIIQCVSDLQKQAAVLCEMDVDVTKDLLVRVGVDRAVQILNFVSPDDAADIVKKLPEDFSEQVLNRLHPEEGQEVETLIQYRSESAGGIMSPEVFSLPEDLTVRDAIREVQESRNVETVFYLYIVNRAGCLVGILSLKKLLLVPPESLLKDVMQRDPVRVRIDEDQEEVAKIVARYNFLSVPVVDENNKLVGVVTVDDVLDVIRDEATEDILLMTGAEKEAMEEAPLWQSLRRRMPWLLMTLLGGVVASEVIAGFSSVLLKTTVLVGFIPVVLGLGGNVGLQTMTIVVRGLAIGRLSLADLGWVLFKELRVVLILGLLYGLLLAGFIALRYGYGTHIPVAIGMSIAGTMLLSVSIGALIPIVFGKMGIDPAVATGPIVITAFDILAMWLYFALAAFFLN